MIGVMFAALAVLGILAVIVLFGFARAYLRDPGPAHPGPLVPPPLLPEVHHDEYAQQWHPGDWEDYERAEAEAWRAEVLAPFPPWPPFTDWESDTYVGGLTAITGGA